MINWLKKLFRILDFKQPKLCLKDVGEGRTCTKEYGHDGYCFGPRGVY